MTTITVTTRGGRGARVAVTLRQKLPLLAALVLLWMMLWGSTTLMTILTGVIVALIVTSALPLPPVQLSGRFNPFWFAVFVARVLGEMVIASFQVAFIAVGSQIGRAHV